LSLGLKREAAAVESAIASTLGAGARTADIAAAGETAVGTREFGAAVVSALRTIQS
jgi:3-isopropylmalate dehydrogenase